MLLVFSGDDNDCNVGNVSIKDEPEDELDDEQLEIAIQPLCLLTEDPLCTNTDFVTDQSFQQAGPSNVPIKQSGKMNWFQH